MNKNSFAKLLNLVYLLIPLALILYVYFSIGVHLPITNENTAIYQQNMAGTMASWKSLRHFSIIFYALTIFFVRKHEQKKNIKLPISTKAWLAGLLLTIFSFAIGGAFVDLGYLGWFIEQGIEEVSNK